MPWLLPATRCALTAPFHPYPATWPGGILSVALSVDSRRPGITWRPAPVEPGLSSAEPELIKNQSDPTAIARLTPVHILGWNGNSVKPAPVTMPAPLPCPPHRHTGLDPVSSLITRKNGTDLKSVPSRAYYVLCPKNSRLTPSIGENRCFYCPSRQWRLVGGFCQDC